MGLTACSELGLVKYLKDADDFDLDPEQLVSDVFVNEGKADRDGLDQEATIKIIQEQGQAVRQGSVVPDLSPIHYQKRPPPPVPRFSEIPSTLGKRDHDLVNGRFSPGLRYGSKRFRPEEIDETHENEDTMIPSVERSPEIIQDTQASPDNTRRANVKLESPELSRSFRNVAPATEDELELLPEMPPGFPVNRRNYVLGGEHVTPKANGVVDTAARRSSAANPSAHLPITPPTDPTLNGPTSRGSATNGRNHHSRSPAPGASSTISKFKPARQSLYEMPESDIEDSQMSPRAKHSMPVPRLVRRMSSIERITSQQQGSLEAFHANVALDPMDLDDEANTQAFIAEKRHSVSMHNDFSGQAARVAAARKDDSDHEIEISATVSSPKKGKSSQADTSIVGKGKLKKAQEAAENASGAENAAPESASAVTNKTTSTHTKATAPAPDEELSKNQKKKSKKRKKNSVDESQSELKGQQKQGNTVGAGKPRRRSSELDSPGEQLTQGLTQTFAPVGSNVSSKLASVESKSDGRPSTSGSGSTDASTSTPTSRRSSSSKMGSSPGRLGLGITNSPRKKKAQNVEASEKQLIAQSKKDKAAEPTFTERVKQAKPEKASKDETSKSKDVSPAVNDTVVPSVEKVGNSRGAKPRAVENLDTQCGVPLAFGDRQCGRALDCKIHSMKKKRAVPGRSQPLDTLLAEYKKSKGSGTESTPKLSVPNWGSDQAPSTTKKPSPAAEATPSAAKASSSKVIPPWMTPEAFDKATKANDSNPVKEIPKKKATKETPKAAPPAPEITVTKDSDKDTSSSSDSDDSDSESESESEASGPKESKLASGSETSEESDSSSESEQEKKSKVAPEKTPKTPTPAPKKAAKSGSKSKAPKANLVRESTTPGSDFDAITANLKALRQPEGLDANKLQHVPPRSALKKTSTSGSSVTSSDVLESASKMAIPSADSNKKTKATSAKSNKSSDEATPQPAKSTPKATAQAKTSNPKVSSPATASIPPISGLQKLKGKLMEESKAESSRSSPSTGPAKKIFGKGAAEDEESSNESSSSSESSESDDDGKKIVQGGGKGPGSRVGQAKAKTKAKAGGKGTVSPNAAVPDRSIRDVTPDDSSDED